MCCGSGISSGPRSSFKLYVNGYYCHYYYFIYFFYYYYNGSANVWIPRVKNIKALDGLQSLTSCSID